MHRVRKLLHVQLESGMRRLACQSLRVALARRVVTILVWFYVSLCNVNGGQEALSIVKARMVGWVHLLVGNLFCRYYSVDVFFWLVWWQGSQG